MTRILLISGSLRAASTNTATLRTLQVVAPRQVEAVLYEGMGRLPHFNPDADREGDPVDPAVADLRMQLHQADAVVICTPEYAGALPGALKNLLEWTVGDASTYRKPVAWINVSGPAAPTGGADAHDSLRTVLGYVHAAIVEPACLRMDLTRDAIGSDGRLHAAEHRVRLGEMLEVLVEAIERPRSPTRTQVLFIGGCSGVGKSSAAAEIHAQLSRAEVRHAVIEGDVLDLAWPAPHEQGLALAEHNLRTIWRAYREAGYRRLVYANTVSVRADVMAGLVAALGDDPEVAGVLLGASRPAVGARLAQRERGSGLEEHLNRSLSAAAELEVATPAWVTRVDTTNRTVVEVAAQILGQLSWIDERDR